VKDLEAGKQPELHGLAGEGERAGDHGLRRDDGGERGEPDQGQRRPIRHQTVEGALDRLRMRQDEGALTKVVEDQRREDEADPGGPDGPTPEMAEIGVERLRTRRDEADAPQDGQRDAGVLPQEAQAVERVDGEEDPGVVGDVEQAREREGREPHQHDGAEESRDLARAAALHGKETHEDRQRDRHHVVLQGRRRDLETLHRREHGDRRRDHGVAVEQARARRAEHQHRAAPPSEHPLRQGHQSEGAALAVVVGPQQHDHVFEGDDENQGPEHQGQHADDALARHGAAGARGLNGFAQGVERAGADIAVNDAERAERQGPEARFVMRFRQGGTVRSRRIRMLEALRGGLGHRGFDRDAVW